MEPSRSDFCHPYQPYEIQLELMQNLYRCIEDAKVGIFESPTGTGKSLSLICGSLTWLRDNARRKHDQTFTKGTDALDWLAAAEQVSRHREFLREREEIELKLATIRRKEAARKNEVAILRASKKTRVLTDSTLSEAKRGDDEFLLDEYNSDQDGPTEFQKQSAFSSSTQALLDKLKPVLHEEEELDQDITQVIFCSRTHSQLTQFIHELRRVNPPSGLPQDPEAGSVTSINDSIKHLPLGSRKNLCINPSVLHLANTTAINERCLELQKPKTAKENKCKHLPTKDDKQRIQTFRNHAIATIRDIEDVAELGRRMELCPYYASRPAILNSEILTLPYPLLLQKSAREALGVRIKDNIVIIDEAHNLMDAIADTCSVSLSLSQLEFATHQVVGYVQRFKNKLKGQNRMYITQVIRLLNSLTACLKTCLIETKQGEAIVTAHQLMSGRGVDQIKPHKLLQYLVESKLAHKVDGYAESQEQADTSIRPRGILMHVQNFLAALMNPAAEGRFFVSKQEQDVTVRFTLLDPKEHFRDIVESARAIILAGGTMSPMSDYANYLFSYLEPGRLQTFSFGHIVPNHNILVEPVTTSINEIEFDFTFNKRGSEAMIAGLGITLTRVCQLVPDGVVAFFPSYEYLTRVIEVWKQHRIDGRIFDNLTACKSVFEETKGVPVDELLRDFSQAVDTGKGGLMLSVVGGKLSEGINFSDKLGRAVVAIGLPFPNMKSAEWKARIEHVEKLRFAQCKQEQKHEQQCTAEAKAAGRDFYENACMRAINQSIGRAIRHKNDYAAILLFDRRFATDRIRSKLPRWIRSSMAPGSQQGQPWPALEQGLVNFFHDKQ